MKPEPTQNDSKIDAEIGLLKKSQKVTSGIPLRFIAFGPNPTKILQVAIFSRFVASKKASENRCRKSMGKVRQQVAKMRPKWMPKPLFFHAFSKKAKTVETVCFTIENLVFANEKTMKNR